MVICDKCNRRFRSAVTLDQHKKELHSETITCYYHDIAGRRQTIIIDRYANGFMCPFCISVIATKSKMERHIQQTKSKCMINRRYGDISFNITDHHRHQEQEVALPPILASTSTRISSLNIRCIQFLPLVRICGLKHRPSYKKILNIDPFMALTQSFEVAHRKQNKKHRTLHLYEYAYTFRENRLLGRADNALLTHTTTFAGLLTVISAICVWTPATRSYDWIKTTFYASLLSFGQWSDRKIHENFTMTILFTYCNIKDLTEKDGNLVLCDAKRGLTTYMTTLILHNGGNGINYKDVVILALMMSSDQTTLIQETSQNIIFVSPFFPSLKIPFKISSSHFGIPTCYQYTKTMENNDMDHNLQADGITTLLKKEVGTLSERGDEFLILSKDIWNCFLQHRHINDERGRSPENTLPQMSSPQQQQSQDVNSQAQDYSNYSAQPSYNVTNNNNHQGYPLHITVHLHPFNQNQATPLSGYAVPPGNQSYNNPPPPQQAHAQNFLVWISI
ncbi:uncharacterized protein BX664DRAFT_310306 [Halteromyces radiatus]|uniref:uncharacterized protein n=1 Tax=Halteromyces radiatus TaxID=101107 RepID=UPI00221ED65F|nr:uncharacterized protein BX664DRAFT_310306 [Halteromyces radiatus]KAI8099319.1 hypothetical protein BX664DRAFT_310306 [Halteromyces radiatus]